ncbi:hypothetical protein LCGC14_1584240, partial [marine sediment metagenome]
ENLTVDDSCEFGSIGLDCKRPFGNSQVEKDMFEIIGLNAEIKCPNCGDEWSDDQYDYVRCLYYEKLIPYLKEKHGGKDNEYDLGT